MTSGRFEASFTQSTNQKWHARDFFTKHNTVGGKAFRFAEKEMMDKESCPFHDLRADGCFQPMHAEGGQHSPKVLPDRFFNRSGMVAFHTGTAGWRDGKIAGISGVPLALEVVPPAKQETVARKCDCRPWGGGKGKDVFSTFPYIAAPPSTAAPASPRETLKPFVIGGSSAWNDKVIHLPDLTSKPSPRPAFRLKAGAVRPPYDSRQQYVPEGPTSLPKTPRTARVNHRGVFKNPVRDCFNKPAPYLSQPEPTPEIKSARRPFLTYETRTRRCMPVQVPWESGTKEAQSSWGANELHN